MSDESKINRQGWILFAIGFLYSSIIQIFNNLLYRFNLLDQRVNSEDAGQLKITGLEANIGYVIMLFALLMIFQKAGVEYVKAWRSKK